MHIRKQEVTSFCKIAEYLPCISNLFYEIRLYRGKAYLINSLMLVKSSPFPMVFGLYSRLEIGSR